LAPTPDLLDDAVRLVGPDERLKIAVGFGEVALAGIPAACGCSVA
jgi:hypothetical protein